MAVVTTPENDFENFRNLGNVVTLRERRTTKFVSLKSHPSIFTSNVLDNIELAKTKAKEYWDGLSPSGKTALETLAQRFYFEAFPFLYTDTLKQSMQSYYGLITWGAFVYGGQIDT